MRLRFKITVMALVACVLGFSAVDRGWAAAGPWAENDHGRLRLISVSDAIDPSASEGAGPSEAVRPSVRGIPVTGQVKR